MSLSLSSILLLISAFFSAVLTSLTGLAGGVLLISILSSLLPLGQAIALHGLLQMISNGSRVVIFFKHINWAISLRFCLAIIPGCFLGVRLFEIFDPALLKLLIACSILLTVWFSQVKYEWTVKKVYFIPIGFFLSSLSMVVGVVGPMLAPFLLSMRKSKEEFVATKSFCQGSVQAVKVVLFLTVIKFDYLIHSQKIIVLGLAIILGSLFGKILLKKISEQTFFKLVSALLVVLALNLMWEVIPILLKENGLVLQK